MLNYFTCTSYLACLTCFALRLHAPAPCGMQVTLFRAHGHFLERWAEQRSADFRLGRSDVRAWAPLPTTPSVHRPDPQP
jgi:hypothetical protein